jgi:2'-5' RNA ligase
MRLFVAVSIPMSIKQALAKELPRFAHLKFREIPLQNWHITIKFIGEIEQPSKIEEISTIIRNIAARIKPFSISVADVGFINRRIFSFNLEPSPKLFALFRLLDDQLGSKGLAARDRFRAFSPHITVGRKNSPVSRDHLHASRYFDLKTRAPLHFPVSSVDLMESFLHSDGSVYKLLARFPLLT